MATTERRALTNLPDLAPKVACGGCGGRWNVRTTLKSVANVVPRGVRCADVNANRRCRTIQNFANVGTMHDGNKRDGGRTWTAGAMAAMADMADMLCE